MVLSGIFVDYLCIKEDWEWSVLRFLCCDMNMCCGYIFIGMVLFLFGGMFVIFVSVVV